MLATDALAPLYLSLSVCLCLCMPLSTASPICKGCRYTTQKQLTKWWFFFSTFYISCSKFHWNRAFDTEFPCFTVYRHDRTTVAVDVKQNNKWCKIWHVNTHTQGETDNEFFFHCFVLLLLEARKTVSHWLKLKLHTKKYRSLKLNLYIFFPLVDALAHISHGLFCIYTVKMITML